jgi:hypothetical protein
MKVHTNNERIRKRGRRHWSFCSQSLRRLFGSVYAALPAGVDVQGYIAHVAGQAQEAIQLIMKEPTTRLRQGLRTGGDSVSAQPGR